MRDRFIPLNYFKRRRHERRNSKKEKRLGTRGGIVYVRVRGEKWEEILKRVNIFDIYFTWKSMYQLYHH